MAKPTPLISQALLSRQTGVCRKLSRLPPTGLPRALVIVPGLGLIPPETILDTEQLRSVGDVSIDENNQAYLDPLLRDARLLEQSAGPACRYLLLGSIATKKYAEPLLNVFGDRLLFPPPERFVGRGDVSRGGLLLRRAPQRRTAILCEPCAGRFCGDRAPPKLGPWVKPVP